MTSNYLAQLLCLVRTNKCMGWCTADCVLAIYVPQLYNSKPMIHDPLLCSYRENRAIIVAAILKSLPEEFILEQLL